MADLVPKKMPLACVAGLLDIPKDAPAFTEKEKLILTAMAMFKGLLDNTFSGDTLGLAIYRACDLLQDMVPEDEVHEIAAKLINALRSPHPMDSMF